MCLCVFKSVRLCHVFFMFAGATHVCLCLQVLGCQGLDALSLLPLYPQEVGTVTHTHTNTHTSDSRSGCHLFLLWVQSPAEQWDTIRSLQRGSSAFCCRVNTNSGAHTKTLCVCVSVSQLMSASCLSLDLFALCLYLFMHFLLKWGDWKGNNDFNRGLHQC